MVVALSLKGTVPVDSIFFAVLALYARERTRHNCAISTNHRALHTALMSHLLTEKITHHQSPHH
jgi:hypothetical protein